MTAEPNPRRTGEAARRRIPPLPYVTRKAGYASLLPPYVRRGVYPMDWAAAADVRRLDRE